MSSYRVNPKQFFSPAPRATSNPKERYLARKKIQAKLEGPRFVDRGKK